jgi:hypothetical protein
MASRLCASRWKWYVSLRGSGGCISCGTGSVFVGGTSANKISSWLALQTNRCTSGLNPSFVLRCWEIIVVVLDLWAEVKTG